MSNSLVLCFWVRGRGFSDHGFIEASSDTPIRKIRKEICESAKLRSAEDAVRLYKVPDTRALNLSENGYSSILKMLSISQLGHAIRGSQTVSSVFGPNAEDEHLHLIVDIPEVSITCRVRRTGTTAGFGIELSRSDRLYSLVPKAMELWPDLRAVGVGRLKLYVISYNDEDELQEVLDHEGEGVAVPPGQVVQMESDNLPFSSTLNIVIEAVATPTPWQPSSLTRIPCACTIRDERQRFLQDNSDELPPSQSGMPTKFRDRQNQPAKCIPCGRPRETEDRIPAVLLHSVFGEFIDDSKSMKTTPRENQLACNLSFAMSTIYGDEKLRVGRIRKILAEYDIHCVVSKVQNTAYETDGSVSTEGHIYVLLEFKNEVGSGGAEPFFQSIAYYLEWTRNMAIKVPTCALPCLLVCIFGPYIIFAAAAWNLRPTVQLLSIIACHMHSTDSDSFLVLARHMAACRKAVKALKKYYDNLPVEGLGSPQIFPHPTSYVSRIDNCEKKIIYSEQGTIDKLVFFGFENSQDGAPICIKFVRRYSPHAHDHCASLGCAPALRAFETIPGGWFMAVMDDIRAGHTTLHDQMRHSQPNNSWHVPIAAKLAEFHKAGYVHGDIRSTNIMVSKTDFKIIDFDWSGRANDVVYPPLLNPEIRRPDGAIDGEPILAKHDMDMLAAIWDPT